MTLHCLQSLVLAEATLLALWAWRLCAARCGYARTLAGLREAYAVDKEAKRILGTYAGTGIQLLALMAGLS
jgi:hypothetical protein